MREQTAPTPAEIGEELKVELQWQGRCLSVLTVAAIGLMLYVLRPVLVPFVVAVFVTVGLKPLLALLQHRLLPSRLGAVTVAFLLGVALLLILGGAVASSINQLTNDDAYRQSAVDATEKLAVIGERVGLLSGPAEDDPNSGVTAVGQLQSAVRQGVELGRKWLVEGMLSLSGSLGIVLIYMYFLLLGASEATEERGGLWLMIEGKIREYIVLKTVISAATGVAVWLSLAFFGVPLAFLMGLLTFLLNYIPNFGPLVTCVLPLPLIWLSPELSLVAMIAATLLACGVQLVGGNVIEPRMMGSSFELHPIVVLLALMIWFAIWGFVGMLLSVPMTAALKVVLQRIDRTESIARLMGGDLSALSIGRGTD